MKSMIGRRVGLAALSLAFFLGVGLGEARAESTVVTACGQVLSAPGDYHLSGDLGPCAGHGVVITASDVRLTLGGYTLSGISTQESCDLDDPQTGVLIEPGTQRVRVSGGTVRGFVDGIGQSGSASRVTAMRLADNCVFGVVVSGPGNRVDTSRISGSDDGIILCAAQGSVLEANEIFGNFRYAVVLSCYAGANGNQIVRNLLHDNGLPTGDGGGVAIFYGDDNLIAGNAVSGNWDGIWLPTTSGTTVQDNTVNGNLHHGIAVDDLSNGNALLDNTAYGNGGIDVIEGCGVNTWSGNLYGTRTGCP